MGLNSEPPCTIHSDKKESYGNGSQAGVQSILYLWGTTFKVHTRFHYTLEKSGLEFMYGHIDLNENVIMIKYKYLVFLKYAFLKWLQPLFSFFLNNIMHIH